MAIDVPWNVVHNYIGFPVLLFIGIDTLRRNKDNDNLTSRYLGWTCILSSVALLAFGVPALLTHDARLLSIGTLVGDFAYASGMLLLWLIILRAAFGSRPRVLKVMNTLFVLLTFGLYVEALVRNLQTPYSTFIKQIEGGVALTYTDGMWYTVLNGIDSLALLFIGIYFWRQAGGAETSAQKMRIRSLAAGLLCFAAAFVVTPMFTLSDQARISFILISVGIVIIGVFNIVGSLIDRRPTQTPPASE